MRYVTGAPIRYVVNSYWLESRLLTGEKQVRCLYGVPVIDPWRNATAYPAFTR